MGYFKIRGVMKMGKLSPEINSLIDGYENDIKKLEEENKEYEALFRKFWGCSLELNNLWRAENPEERELVLNDLTKLNQWAIDTIKTTQQKNKRLREALEAIKGDAETFTTINFEPKEILETLRRCGLCADKALKEKP